MSDQLVDIIADNYKPVACAGCGGFSVVIYPDKIICTFCGFVKLITSEWPEFVIADVLDADHITT